MPKRRRFIYGFVDPISIIGGLFLVITLIVGALVVKNRQISLNINEQAASAPKPIDGEKGIDNWVNPKPVVNKPPANTKPVDNKLEKEEVGYIQQVITTPVVINGNIVNPATGQPEVNNPVTQPETITPEQTQPVAGPLKECTGSGGTTYPLNAVVVGGASGQSNGYAKCTSNGWIADCDPSDVIRLCGITDLRPNLAPIPTYLQPQYQAAMNALQQNTTNFNQLESAEVEHIEEVNLAEAMSQAAVAVPSQQNQNTQSNNAFAGMAGGSGGTTEVSNNFWTNLFNGGSDTSSTTYNPCPAGSSYINHTCVTNQQNITNVENQIAQYNRPSTSHVVNTSVQELIDSLTNRFNNVSTNTGMTDVGSYGLGGGNTPVVVPRPNNIQQATSNYPIHNFADCNRAGLSADQTAECNQRLSQVYNMPIVGNYIQAYAPENVTYNYDALGYDSLDECLNDVKNAGRGQSKCNGYQATPEQISSSVRLGGAITAASGIIAASGGTALGYMTLPEMVAAGMAASTTFQSTSATATCVDNPDSKECVNEAAWAAISWANIGTYAIANTLSTGTAQTVNAIANFANIGADAFDISQSCGDGEFASSFGCGAAIVGTVFDLGQGVGDVAHAIDNTLLSGLDMNVNSLGDTVIRSPINNIDNNVAAIAGIPPTSHYQSVVGDLNLEEMANISNAVNTSTMPEFPAGLMTDAQINDIKALEVAIRDFRIETNVVRPAVDQVPQNGLPLTIFSSSGNAQLADVWIQQRDEALSSVRNALQEISRTVSPPKSVFEVLPINGSVGRPVVANTDSIMPIFDPGVSREALKIQNLGDGYVSITNTGSNTIHIGLWPVGPTRTIKVKVGDVIELTPNTSFRITGGDSLAGEILVRDNTTSIERFFLGVNTGAEANRVGSLTEPVFFHPGDTIKIDVDVSKNSNRELVAKLENIDLNITNKLPPTTANGRDVVIQMTVKGEKPVILPYGDVNIFPTNNGRETHLEWGTLNDQGEFERLVAISSTDASKPFRIQDLGILTTLDLNTNKPLIQTITHIEPSVIGQLFDQYIPRPVANVIDNYIYSRTGGLLPFVNNIILPNRALDLTITPTTPLTTRIGDWFDNTIGNNPIINRIIGRPEDISLRPNESGIFDPTLSRTLDNEQFIDVTSEFDSLHNNDDLDVQPTSMFDEEDLIASIDEILPSIRERREIIEDIKKIGLTPKQIINAYESGDINEISRISKLLRDNKLDPKVVYKSVIDEYTYLLGVREADINANYLEYNNVPSPVKNKLTSIIEDQYGANTEGFSMEQINDLRNRYLDTRGKLELDGLDIQTSQINTPDVVPDVIIQPNWFERNVISPTDGFLDGARTTTDRLLRRFDNSFAGFDNFVNDPNLATNLYQTITAPVTQTLNQIQSNYYVVKAYIDDSILNRIIGRPEDINLRIDDQVQQPRTANTNNWFDNIIARFDGVAQPSLNNLDTPPVLPKAIKATGSVSSAYPIVGLLTFAAADYIVEEVFDIDLFDFNGNNQTTSIGTEVKGNFSLNQIITEPATVAELIKTVDSLNANDTPEPQVFTPHTQWEKDWVNHVLIKNCKNVDGTRSDRTMTNIGCGPTTTSNILGEFGIDQSPDYVADNIIVIDPDNPDYFCNGTTYSENLEYLEENNLTYDVYSASLGNIPNFVNENSIIWIAADFTPNGYDKPLSHHAYFNGYSMEILPGYQYPQPVLNLVDPNWGDDYKCTITTNYSFDCKNSIGLNLNISGIKDENGNWHQPSLFVINELPVGSENANTLDDFNGNN